MGQGDEAANSNSPPWGGFQQVKFGAGVIGKTAPVAAALLVPILAAMYFLSAFPWMVFTLAVLAALIVAGFIGLAFWYANKHPDFAVLEGGELVRYREIELAAKDPDIIDITPEGSTNIEPPKALKFGGQHDA